MQDTSAYSKHTLSALAWLMVRDANRTFGGGTASSEVLRRSLTRQGWLTNEDHRTLFALSRLTPGTNLLAYCTAVGWQTRGIRGAVVAWLAASVPCSIMAVGATLLYDRLAKSPATSLALLMATTIALALLAASAWHLAKPQVNRQAASRSIVIVLLVLSFLAMGASPIAVLLTAAVAGALWPSRP